MGVWLYPVSGARTFRDARGRRRPTTIEEIAQAVAERRFPDRPRWPCAQNGANVAPGDELLIYTGEDDVGIFAAGLVVEASRARGGRGWTLTWTLDAARTRRLLDAPVPAAMVRKHVHPRVTIRDFRTGARALRARLR